MRKVSTKKKAFKAAVKVEKYLSRIVNNMLDDDLTRKCFMLQTRIEDEEELHNTIVLALLTDITKQIREDLSNKSE